MGHETRLNYVEDPVKPGHEVRTAGDLEAYLVCGGENGMKVCEREGVQCCGFAMKLVRQ